MDPQIVADKLETALIYCSRGLTAAEAARRVDWTRPTFYRHLKAAHQAHTTDTTTSATTGTDVTTSAGIGRTATSPVGLSQERCKRPVAR